ncbi:MAG: PilZ domain-containing protein [Novosphingobium sp.]
MIERGRREQSRLRLRLPCRLITRGGDQRALIVDLSRTGARVHAEQLACERGDAVLRWFDMESFGQLVWARSGFCGIRFYDPVPVAWLLQSRTLNETDCDLDDRQAARDLAREWVSGARRI